MVRTEYAMSTLEIVIVLQDILVSFVIKVYSLEYGSLYSSRTIYTCTVVS